MSLIFFNGFETGDMFGWKSWVGSGASVQDTIKKAGTYALRVNPSTNSFQFFARTDNPNRISFCFHIATAPSGLISIAGLSSGVQIRLTTDRYLQLYNNGELLSTGLTQLTLDTWFRISCSYSPSTNAVKLYINGVEKFSETGLSASDGPGYMYGLYGALISADVYFDNIIEDDTDSLEDLGNIEVLFAKVNGAGEYAEFDSYTAGGSPIHYENVDGYPGDSYENWHDGSSYARESYSIEDCSTIGISAEDTIKGVCTYCKMGCAKGSNQNILIRDNGVDDEVPFNVGTFFIYFNRVDAVMPADGEAWTQERFNALEVGMSVGQTRKDPGISNAVVFVAFSGTGDEPELPPDDPPPPIIRFLIGSLYAQSETSADLKGTQKIVGSLAVQSNLLDVKLTKYKDVVVVGVVPNDLSALTSGHRSITKYIGLGQVRKYQKRKKSLGSFINQWKKRR